MKLHILNNGKVAQTLMPGKSAPTAQANRILLLETAAGEEAVFMREGNDLLIFSANQTDKPIWAVGNYFNYPNHLYTVQDGSYHALSGIGVESVEPEVAAMLAQAVGGGMGGASASAASASAPSAWWLVGGGLLAAGAAAAAAGGGGGGDGASSPSTPSSPPAPGNGGKPSVPPVSDTVFSGTMRASADSTKSASGHIGATSKGQPVAVQDAEIQGTYGKFSLHDGQWRYTVDANKARVLGAGETAVDTFTVKTEDGGRQNINITVRDRDDPSVISGSSAGSVRESDGASVSGKLNISDPDRNDHPRFLERETDGLHGKFAMTSDGRWTYTLNSHSDGLGEGMRVTETFTATASDGNSRNITVTVHGSGGSSELPYFISSLVHTPITLSWTEKRGQGAELSYSFIKSSQDNGFEPYTATQQNAVRNALKAWSEVSNLTFRETADSDNVDIRFQRDSLSSQGGDAVGYAETLFYPNTGEINASIIHLKNTYDWVNDASNNIVGSVKYPSVAVHEIGHALGLKHPGHYGHSDEAPFLPSGEDSTAFTVMSYHGAEPSEYFYTDKVAQIFDVAAIQYLYGVNPYQRTGSDTYTIGDRYIWDGGGNDTLDASAERQAVYLNLNGGTWQHSGARSDSLLDDGQAFIGYGTVIENAEGSRFNDTIVGNSANNIINGNGGNDFISGGGGNDRLSGGAGNDVLYGGGGRDTLTGGSGRDTFLFAERPNNGSADVITDFTVGEDRIGLAKEIFSTLAGGITSAHIGGAAAATADQHLLYDRAPGKLSYDADGNGSGAPIHLATLSNHLEQLEASNFYLA